MVAKDAACVRHFRVNVKSVIGRSGRLHLYGDIIEFCVCVVTAGGFDMLHGRDGGIGGVGVCRDGNIANLVVYLQLS